jgi:hypothetical protein
LDVQLDVFQYVGGTASGLELYAQPSHFEQGHHVGRCISHFNLGFMRGAYRSAQMHFGIQRIVEAIAHQTHRQHR